MLAARGRRRDGARVLGLERCDDGAQPADIDDLVVGLAVESSGGLFELIEFDDSAIIRKLVRHRNINAANSCSTGPFCATAVARHAPPARSPVDTFAGDLIE